jgi:5-methylcytosine-specific restriction protein B
MNQVNFNAVNKDHILAALKKLKAGEIPASFNSSTVYNLLHEGADFAPKMVFALAYEIATGVRPVSTDFEGGEGTQCFKSLRKAGFKIALKSELASIYEPLSAEIRKFSSSYILAKDNKKNFTPQHMALKGIGDRLQALVSKIGYENIIVKTSIGQGGFADVPWICLFDPRITTKASAGHYPVYLFAADMKQLYLAYCISNGEMDKNAEGSSKLKEKLATDLAELNTIGFNNQMDLRSALATPRGYEKGNIASKSYSLSKDTKVNVLQDLDVILRCYDKIAGANGPAMHTAERIKAAPIFSNMHIHAKLKTSSGAKPFTILAGGTGTGKTRAAKLVATSIAGKDNVEVVAVGADWTDNRPLLGFRNLLAEGGKTYVAPPALRIILKAIENPAKPYFLILDEMNLSHVERYFADFLSSMESKEPLKLHDSAESLMTEDGIAVKGKVEWPSNLFVIGTVNIDETTYMFSPKVLDRAHVIEFKVQWDEIAAGLESVVSGETPALAPAQVDEFMRVAGLKDKALSDEDHDALVEVLGDMHEALDGTRFVFAHRTARECLNFIASAQALAKAGIVETQDISQLIDLAVLQKALPKLNGSAGTLSNVLEALIKVADKHDLELSGMKLRAMQTQLKADQFVSFIQ